MNFNIQKTTLAVGHIPKKYFKFHSADKLRTWHKDSDDDYFVNRSEMMKYIDDETWKSSQTLNQNSIGFIESVLVDKVVAVHEIIRNGIVIPTYTTIYSMDASIVPLYDSMGEYVTLEDNPEYFI